jgi:hypothetical protein
MDSRSAPQQEVSDLHDKTLDILQSIMETGEKTIQSGAEASLKLKEQQEKLNLQAHSDMASNLKNIK